MRFLRILFFSNFAFLRIKSRKITFALIYLLKWLLFFLLMIACLSCFSRWRFHKFEIVARTLIHNNKKTKKKKKYDRIAAKKRPRQKQRRCSMAMNKFVYTWMMFFFIFISFTFTMRSLPHCINFSHQWNVSRMKQYFLNWIYLTHFINPNLFEL